MSPLQVILAFAALHAGLVAPVPGVAESPLASAAGTLALFGGLWLAFHAWSLVCRRRLDRGQSSGWRGADAAMRATQWASLAALFAAGALLGWLDGVRAAVGDLPAVDELMASIIEAEPLAELVDAEVLRADTLERVDPLYGPLRLLAVARVGPTRLLDNLGVTVHP